MKLSTLAITFTLALTSAQAFAQKVVFKPVSDNLETQACLTAANDGYFAARKLIRKSGLDFVTFSATVSCNGVSLKKFANLYADNSDAVASSFALVAKDQDVATQACLDALSIGETQALAKYNLEGETIFCNSKSMTNFVRRYNAQNVVVKANSAE
ncbi:DUF3718 domain-containing protein [Alteromonas gilva]|uniref:DUF3718 domain-containing protein n=1 Tax=Alteromonas gilva TaxID=2987522 RepID=A0ABT5L4M7_9ALTE|nr:DUF3718 domain-containing protein [Alteromonas gilva]MDC8832002.1 DUF3718 domain-containing protein [Alteromonas gilva]